MNSDRNPGAVGLRWDFCRVLIEILDFIHQSSCMWSQTCDSIDQSQIPHVSHVVHHKHWLCDIIMHSPSHCQTPYLPFFSTSVPVYHTMSAMNVQDASFYNENKALATNKNQLHYVTIPMRKQPTQVPTPSLFEAQVQKSATPLPREGLWGSISASGARRASFLGLF